MIVIRFHVAVVQDLFTHCPHRPPTQVRAREVWPPGTWVAAVVMVIHLSSNLWHGARSWSMCIESYLDYGQILCHSCGSPPTHEDRHREQIMLTELGENVIRGRAPWHITENSGKFGLCWMSQPTVSGIIAVGSQSEDICWWVAAVAKENHWLLRDIIGGSVRTWKICFVKPLYFPDFTVVVEI